MDLVAGAMGNVAPKLLELLRDEYKLQTGVKAQVKSLADELGAMHLALCKVAGVPYDELDPQVKLWASEAREEEYDMEDVLDTFLVSFNSGNQTADADKSIVSRILEEMGNMFSRFKTRHKIAGTIEGLKKRVNEIAERRERYKIDDFVANSTATTRIDPRVLMILGTKASDLVGIDDQSDALVEMLTNERAELLQSRKRKLKRMNMGVDDASNKETTKIVSIVGSGGLGKTTLANVVYEKLLTVDKKFSCKAFVPVGRNPDLKKVLRDILIELDKSQYMPIINSLMQLDEKQLIEEIRGFLTKKRYFIVIDDVWDVPSWNVIRTALRDNNSGSKIMITTRSSDVAELVLCTYKIQPLPPERSKTLFYGRLFGSRDRCPESLFELSDKILKKCHGVPLAIITLASLLANKSDDIAEWQEVCDSIGYGLRRSNDMYRDMMKILSLSYYDLPSHMKTCFLYLSMYPEDYRINRDQLIWRWICEGFIQPQKKGDDLFELGKSYFNDLINRSLIQPCVGRYDEIVEACRVHDMILDLICSLSREENFVTTSDDIEKGMSSESQKLRRLSLKSTGMRPRKGVSQVRTIAFIGSSIDSMPSFSRLDMLRVLDLEGCSLADRGDSNKLCIRKLVHLRYLRLCDTDLKVLPGGIEKLHFLLVLEMDGDTELPESIFGLRQLMCLEGVHCCPRTGNLLRNLASLQVLNALYVGKDPVDTLEALGHLTRLTKLTIHMVTKMVDQRICDTFIDSLSNLQRLQHLCIIGHTGIINWERWAPPPHLRELIRVHSTFSCTLHKWISPASLPHLGFLDIEVHTVGPEDIQILGMLPNLVVLRLMANCLNYVQQPLQKFVVSADAFPRLTICALFCVVIVPSIFTWGAMPRLREFLFGIRAWDFSSNHAQGGFDFDDLAMDHLPCLKTIQCPIFSTEIDEESEVEKLLAAVKHAADVHPNHPRIFCGGR